MTQSRTCWHQPAVSPGMHSAVRAAPPSAAAAPCELSLHCGIITISQALQLPLSTLIGLPLLRLVESLGCSRLMEQLRMSHRIFSSRLCNFEYLRPSTSTVNGCQTSTPSWRTTIPHEPHSICLTESVSLCPFLFRFASNNHSLRAVSNQLAESLSHYPKITVSLREEELCGLSYTITIS